MHLSFLLEYSGNCAHALNFYSSIFPGALVSAKTFREMDNADAFGITGSGLDMIWKSELCIPYADSRLYFEMSDSLLAAMQKNTGFSSLYYNPVIRIRHNDREHIQTLFQKIYKGQTMDGNAENPCPKEIPDPHGICWQYELGGHCGISYCLSFEGFCSEVLAFYEDVFQTKADHVVRYGDSSCKEKIPAAGMEIPAAGRDMIYHAFLPFRHDGCTCNLRLSDCRESALDGINRYRPDALLFYHGHYNPLFTLQDADTDYLSRVFQKLKNGAKLNRPLETDKEGNVSANLIDRYGICWNLHS